MILRVRSMRTELTERTMADLEEHALKRDKRFVVRLVLGLGVALLAGLFIAARLTSDNTAGCAAGAMLGSEPAD